MSEEIVVVPRLPPTLSRIYALLSDGQLHTKTEIKVCMGDAYSTDNAVWQNIFELRQYIDEINQDVVSQVRGRRNYYRLVGKIRPNPNRVVIESPAKSSH